MSTKSSYTFATLRYIHDVQTGEFVNVGIVLFAPKIDFLGILCKKSLRRIKALFPLARTEGAKQSIAYIERKINSIGLELKEQKQKTLFEQQDHLKIEDILAKALKNDDSTLQWGPISSGITPNPEKTLNQLFDRFINAHDATTSNSRRNDDDVWRKFSRSLDDRRILHIFEEKIISSDDDEVVFEHAWKNGSWHCLAPISLDLANADSIKEKAHKWLGQLASVSDSHEKFNVYFLIGRSDKENLLTATQAAEKILKKSPITNKVFYEDQANDLGEILEIQVRNHFANHNQHT